MNLINATFFREKVLEAAPYSSLVSPIQMSPEKVLLMNMASSSVRTLRM
jgi:hypothetical protein